MTIAAPIHQDGREREGTLSGCGGESQLAHSGAGCVWLPVPCYYHWRTPDLEGSPGERALHPGSTDGEAAQRKWDVSLATLGAKAEPRLEARPGQPSLQPSHPLPPSTEEEGKEC